MDTIDTTSDAVRFTADWAGQTHVCFLAEMFVDHDAGRKLSRDDAIIFVRAHLARYIAEARAQHGDGNPERVVVIERKAA